MFTQHYEILKLVGGFGLAKSPHGEITNVFDHRYQAEIALIAAEQGHMDVPSVWIVDGKVIRNGLLSVLTEASSEPPLPEDEVLHMNREQFNSLRRKYLRQIKSPA